MVQQIGRSGMTGETASVKKYFFSHSLMLNLWRCGMCQNTAPVVGLVQWRVYGLRSVGSRFVSPLFATGRFTNSVQKQVDFLYETKKSVLNVWLFLFYGLKGCFACVFVDVFRTRMVREWSKMTGLHLRALKKCFSKLLNRRKGKKNRRKSTKNRINRPQKIQKEHFFSALKVLRPYMAVYQLVIL